MKRKAILLAMALAIAFGSITGFASNINTNRYLRTNQIRYEQRYEQKAITKNKNFIHKKSLNKNFEPKKKIFNMQKAMDELRAERARQEKPKTLWDIIEEADPLGTKALERYIKTEHPHVWQNLENNHEEIRNSIENFISVEDINNFANKGLEKLRQNEKAVELIIKTVNFIFPDEEEVLK